jgi:hypothetical protein
MAKAKSRIIPDMTPDMTDDQLQVMAAHIAHDLGLPNQRESRGFVLSILQTHRKVTRLEAFVCKLVTDRKPLETSTDPSA